MGVLIPTMLGYQHLFVLKHVGVESLLLIGIDLGKSTLTPRQVGHETRSSNPWAKLQVVCKFSSWDSLKSKTSFFL